MLIAGSSGPLGHDVQPLEHDGEPGLLIGCLALKVVLCSTYGRARQGRGPAGPERPQEAMAKPSTALPNE
jgi:hypothetical protein